MVVTRSLKLRFPAMVLLSMFFLTITFYYSTSATLPVPYIMSILERNNTTVKTPIPERPKKLKEFLHLYENFNVSQDLEDELAYLRICKNFGDGVQIVFVVTSSPTHEQARNVIRRTWGSLCARRNLAMAFIIGKTDDKAVVQKLEEEQLNYGDLIRGKFLDTYDNLTLKTTWMLRWVNKYCPKATYVFKTDDDVFVNIELLLTFIEQNKISENRSIYGHLVKNWHPVRDKNDKYYISTSQFESDTFPDFTTGPAYMFPKTLASELYNEALNLPYVKLEDVFYNGIVANRLNISRIDIPEFVNNWVSLDDCTIIKTITAHGLWGEYFYFFWYRINSADKTKCS